MDKSFDGLFSKFMWGTDIVLLAASTPHIAAWYEHFDGGTGLASVYGWIVGFGLAIAIDGVSLMLLLALTRMIRRGDKNKGVVIGILLFMTFISALSWFINWQYDKQFATDTFATADSISIWHSITVGTLNPIIGGAFSILILAYALVSKVIKEEEKPTLTEEEYQQEIARIQRENDLKALRNSNKKGILSASKEALIGQSVDSEILLDKTLAYLRDATTLLQDGYEQAALQAISTHLKIKSKAAYPLFIQAKSLIIKEQQEAMIATQKIEDKQQETLNMNVPTNDNQLNMSSDTDALLNAVHLDDKALLDQLKGRDTIPVSEAANMLNCTEKYIVTLRNAGKLKHQVNRKDLITVASLRNYRDTHRKRNTQQTPALHIVNG